MEVLAPALSNLISFALFLFRFYLLKLAAISNKHCYLAVDSCHCHSDYSHKSTKVLLLLPLNSASNAVSVKSITMTGEIVRLNEHALCKCTCNDNEMMLRQLRVLPSNQLLKTKHILVSPTSRSTKITLTKVAISSCKWAWFLLSSFFCNFPYFVQSKKRNSDY